MFIVFLAIVYSMGIVAGANGTVDPVAWKAAHPYQSEKAPANPAQVTGNNTSENP